MDMRHSFFAKFCLTLMMLSLIGCGSNGSSSNVKAGSITAQLQWTEKHSSTRQWSAKSHSVSIQSVRRSAAAPQGVVTVRIVVSGPDMSNVQKDFPASDGTGIIDGVPAGSNRTLTAQGLNASNVVTHQGTISNITVQAGQVTDVGTVVMNPAGETYTVSGTVTLSGSGLSGVTVSLQGTNFSTVTGADGTYSLTVPNASYTIVPSLAGYTFTPATRSIPDGNGNVIGQDFIATAIPPQTFNVSGTITLDGNGLSGVTVSLQGTNFSTITGANGAYALTGIPNGSFTLIPSLTGYTFTPANRSVSVNNGDVSGQDFTASALTFTISGTITLNSTGLAGVTVSLQGTSSASVTTAADGTYSFTGLQNGLYTVTPSLAGYMFTPVNLSVPVDNGDVTGQDVTATAQASATFPAGTGPFRIAIDA
jgi:hypothetical protein